MPKRVTRWIVLPADQPNCCADCPFLGLIPKEQDRPKGSKKTLVCCATWEAISKRGSRIKKSQRDKCHPLHRPCDDMWGFWTSLPGRKFPLRIDDYNKYIGPYRFVEDHRIKF